MNYFKEFYKNEINLELNKNNVQKNGYKKVKKVIEKFGKESYLEIPNKWEDLEKLIN